MKVKITDRATYKVTSREYTDEGFLNVPARVARTGIQEYLAGELGLDGDPNRIVRVMRPPEEVFKAESLDSYNGIDVTIHHPSELVNPDTYKDVTAGTVTGPGIQDTDFVLTNLKIKSREGIDVVEGGMCECSVGYTAVYDDDVPPGADYEFIQRDIICNHVAIVDRARAGRQARIFDSEGTIVKITLVSGKVVEVNDEASADIIREMSAELEKSKAVNDSLKDELKAAKVQSSDAEIKKRLKAASDAVGKMKKLVGKSFTSDSVDVLDIYREGLTAKSPSIKWADKSDIYVQTRIDILDEDMEEEVEDEDMEDEEEEKKVVDSQYKRLAKDASTVAKPKHQLGDCRQAFVDSLQGAWKRSLGDK